VSLLAVLVQRVERMRPAHQVVIDAEEDGLLVLTADRTLGGCENVGDVNLLSGVMSYYTQAGGCQEGGDGYGTETPEDAKD
jgi:hypothetical protein